MTIDLTAYYSSLLAQASDANSEAIRSNSGEIAAAHSKLADLNNVFDMVKGREEYFVYESVSYDIGMSLFLAISGFYRQSYVSQRAALENGFAGIYHSAHLIKLRPWKLGKTWVSWSKVVTKEGGVLTAEFMEAFFPGVSSHRIDFLNTATDLYSNLSDLVHKKVTTQKLDAANFSYDSEQFNSALASLVSVIDLLASVFLTRYICEIEPSDLESRSTEIDHFVGYIPAFQKVIGGQAE